MPKLLITQDCTGSPDGITSAAFKAGETYDVTDHLAPILVDAGWAIPADDKPKEAPPAMNTATIETKVAPSAPENKAAAPAPENKGKSGKAKGK